MSDWHDNVLDVYEVDISLVSSHSILVRSVRGHVNFKYS